MHGQLDRHFALCSPKAIHLIPGEHGEISGDYRWEGKVACCSTKAAISLKRVKMEEKLLWRAYGNSPTLFRTYHPRPPTASSSPKIGGSQPSPKTPIAIILGTGEATDFKFGRNILRIYLNKSPLKTFEKRKRGRIRGLPKFWGYPNYLRNG